MCWVVETSSSSRPDRAWVVELVTGALRGAGREVEGDRGHARLAGNPKGAVLGRLVGEDLEHRAATAERGAGVHEDHEQRRREVVWRVRRGLEQPPDAIRRIPRQHFPDTEQPLPPLRRLLLAVVHLRALGHDFGASAFSASWSASRSDVLQPRRSRMSAAMTLRPNVSPATTARRGSGWPVTNPAPLIASTCM